MIIVTRDAADATWSRVSRVSRVVYGASTQIFFSIFLGDLRRVASRHPGHVGSSRDFHYFLVIVDKFVDRKVFAIQIPIILLQFLANMEPSQQTTRPMGVNSLGTKCSCNCGRILIIREVKGCCNGCMYVLFNNRLVHGSYYLSIFNVYLGEKDL